MIKLPSGPWWPVLIHLNPSKSRISYVNEYSFEDCITGNSPLEALQHADWNWPDAEWIEIQWDRGVSL